ncbi:hypothetical protein MRB53_016626 [Persea americana]|uniref:Uncharacterized protein n=1 Tax=Persea americana TaxID=3435 RepID=A0ACC2M428_PERAE|nr:hypothetical protein MRB53_016626 [Persea americana]
MVEGMQGLQMEVQLRILEENLLSAEDSTRKTSRANHVVVERGLWRCSIPTNGDARSAPSKSDRRSPNDSTVVSTDDKNGKNVEEVLTELGKAYPDKATIVVAKRNRVQNETTFLGAGGSLANIWGCASAKSKPSRQSPETATVVTGLIVTKDAHICAREALEATGKNTNTIPLAREILVDPVRVTVVEVGMVNEGITQIVNATLDDAKKMPWLLERLPGMIDEGDVLLFASRKAIVEENELQWIQRLFKVATLHGDKDQASQLDTS